MKQISRTIANRREARFAAVGLINTAIDFTILNILTSVVGLPRIPANIASTSAAMTFSFWANKVHVFKSGGSGKRQAVLFVAGTVFSLYVLQTIVIYTFSEAWLWPVDTAETIIESVGLSDVFSRDFITTNVAKVLATIVSLVWNYWFYQRLVFAQKDEHAS